MEQTRGPDLVTDSLTNRRGHSLYCRYWRPARRPAAALFLCHGYGEHLGWYDGLAVQLAAAGILVFGHDHQVSR